MKNKDYENLRLLSRQAKVLEGVKSLLEWDLETCMPQEAIEPRSEQLKVLAGLIHQNRTSKTYKNAIEKLIDLKTGAAKAKDLTKSQHAALREWRRDYLKDTALPQSFVEIFAETTSKGIQKWQEAKKSNDFKLFEDSLKKIIDLNREKADLLGYENHPYDALLDLFEPGVTTKELTALFQELKDDLAPFVKKIAGTKQVNDAFLYGAFSHQKQIDFGKIILKDMGYDFNRGRLDLAPHPFSSSAHPFDSRVTTRIHEKFLMSNISSVIHEGGHSLYEMALPVEEFGTPLCEAVSYGIHESQSRFWETRIGLSRPFWKYFLPKLKNHFKKLNSATLDGFYKGINKVEPTLIRVEADEVTYNLHIILRFELEKSLLERNLSVKDIPQAWNEKMYELFGIKPKNDGEGCLQDIHWSMGAFGYFPSYALGNLMASHIFNGFEKAHPEWERRVSTGDLIFIKEWLNQNVHRHGRRYSSRELIEKIDGKPLSCKPFMDYLKGKYSKIYKL